VFKVICWLVKEKDPVDKALVTMALNQIVDPAGAVTKAAEPDTQVLVEQTTGQITGTAVK